LVPITITPGGTRDPDSLPDSTDRSGPCPRCGRVAAFQVQFATPLKPDGSEQAVVNTPMAGSGEDTHNSSSVLPTFRSV